MQRPLAPPPDEVTVLIQLFQQAHYGRAAINADSYADIITDFMAQLDGQHVTFRQSDRDQLMTQLARPLYFNLSILGNTSAAPAILKVYRSRCQERFQWIERQLKGPLPFVAGESCLENRLPTSWPESLGAAEALWLQRIKAEVLEEMLTGLTEPNARRLVQERYRRLNESLESTAGREIADEFLSTVAQRYDSHCRYFGPSAIDEYAPTNAGEIVGVGLLLHECNGGCCVSEVAAGGPAFASGVVSPGDRILTVGEIGRPATDCRLLGMRAVALLLRGTPGSRVELTLRPANAIDPSERKRVTLTRGPVETTALRPRALMVTNKAPTGHTPQLAVITVASFFGEVSLGDDQGTTSSSRDVARLLGIIRDLGAAGVVLDLRRNGGGFLQEAIDIAGQFTGDGPIVQVRSYDGKMSVESSPHKEPIYRGPVIVLVDAATASGAEIVVGVLQEYGRAVIVGGPTCGNGIVQTVLGLQSLMPGAARRSEKTGMARLTIQKFYLPSGASTQLKGITPDILLRMPADSGAERELDLAHHLGWDEISSCNPPKTLLSPEVIQAVRGKSLDRQRTLADLVAEKEVYDWLVRCRSRPLPLSLDARREQIDSDRAFLRKIDLLRRSAAEDGFVGFRVELNPEPSEASGAMKAARTPEVLPELKADTELREALRILTDLLSA